jgi:hypothetical protein
MSHLSFREQLMPSSSSGTTVLQLSYGVFYAPGTTFNGNFGVFVRT